MSDDNNVTSIDRSAPEGAVEPRSGTGLGETSGIGSYEALKAILDDVRAARAVVAAAQGDVQSALERGVAFGLSKAAINLIIKLDDMDPEKRDRFSEQVGFGLDALGVQMSLFEGAEL